MRLTVLGCNGPYPAPEGACSGYFVEAEGAAVQLDLGSGVLGRLTGRMPPEELTALLFSHWHGDHCSDLLPLIYRLGSVAQRLGSAYRPLPVYGPEDPASPVWREAAGCPLLSLRAVRPGESLALGPVTVEVFRARHPVPGVMYRLRAGEKCLAYTGDSNTSGELLSLAREADLLLADGLFPRAAWGEEKPHLSAAQCGELARDAGAARLVVTHLNPEFDPESLLREAREAFPGALLAQPGLTLEV